MNDLNQKRKAGVTLIELIAVLVILGILTTISVVFIGGIIDNANQKADLANLSNLNEATRNLRISQLYSQDDVFEGYDTDEDRLTYLFEEDFISTIPILKNDENSFEFRVDVQQWVIISNSVVIYTPTDEVYFTTDSTLSYRITSYDISGGLNVVIPQTISDTTITEIGSTAFPALGITSVVLQEGITRISGNAFKDNQLSSVTIPDSVERIWHNAFNNNQLTSITFGSGLTRIEGGAFGNNQLTSVSLPSSVLYVGDGAFGYGGNYITSITIGSNVSIGNSHSFGWYGSSFQTLYNVDKLAGTYIYDSGVWTLQT
jgi:prepilin-type N-terminal cleavage/methylation domain-containing protein